MSYIPSFTNFIFVNLGMDARDGGKKLLEQGIIISPGSTWDLPEYARITIGKQEQMRS
jgi:histidinol-phosphate aminotransferase